MKRKSDGSRSAADLQAVSWGPSNSSVEKKLSATALSQQSPVRLMLWRAPMALSRSLTLAEANSAPRSVWKTRPGTGLRAAMARRRASAARSESSVFPTHQPTILREYRSMTATR